MQGLRNPAFSYTFSTSTSWEKNTCVSFKQETHSIGIHEYGEIDERVVRNVELLNEHQELQWIRAILEDNVQTLEDIIESSSQQHRLKFVNGRFTFAEGFHDGILFSKFKSWKLSTSLSIAVALCSVKAIQWLIKQGCDVTMTEDGGYNIIHVLIIMAFLHPGKEAEYEQILDVLSSALPEDTYRQLLLNECSNKQRPLEYAVAHDMFKIVMKILNSSSLYLVSAELQGAYIAKTYDITDYETDRHQMSPLNGLIFIDKHSLKSSPYADDFFKSDFIRAWIKAKIKKIIPFALLWFVFRLIFVSMFYAMTVIQYFDFINFASYTSSAGPADSSVNITSPHIPPVLSTEVRLFIFYYLLIYSACMTLFDLIEIFQSFRIKTYSFGKTFTGMKYVLLSQMFYRVSQFILSVAVFLLFLNGLQTQTSFSLQIRNFITINITVNAIWSLLYFVQLLPWIGHFVIAIQKMITDLLQFLLLLLLFMAPFWLGFQRLFSQNPLRSVPADFADTKNAIYSTFLIALNMLDVQGYKTDDELATAMMHIMYAMLVSILLFNLLIAVFSNSYTRVWKHRNLIMTVQRLAFVFTIENRLYPFCRNSCYKYLSNRAFNKHTDRYYITTHELASSYSFSSTIKYDKNLYTDRDVENTFSKNNTKDNLGKNIIYSVKL